MRLLRQSGDLLPADLGGAVAIGNFDGVHMGHQALLRLARTRADRLKKPLLALTFEPHPRRFFMPEAPPFRLDALERKAELLGEAGVDVVLALPFDAALAALSPEAFVSDVLRGQLKAAHVVVGYDFTFGQARAGGTDLLKSLGAKQGFGVDVVAAVGEVDVVYSSTRVRQHLEMGEPEKAAHILGRPWEVQGAVLHGDKRGRTIGFPTANVDMGDFLVPRLGVYAVRLRRADGAVLNGVANVGRRPTFGKEAVALEVHVFDFAGDLYGETVRVAFHAFLRPEQKFSGLDALKAQIAADSSAARKLLG